MHPIPFQAANGRARARPASASPRVADAKLAAAVAGAQLPSELLDFTHLDDRISAVQVELNKLRAEFPDLDLRVTELPRHAAPRTPGRRSHVAAAEAPLPTGPAPFVHRGNGGTTVRRLPRPGQQPFGYRMLARYPSTPAYTFRPKIVLSRNVDPLVADDGPGPGACAFWLSPHGVAAYPTQLTCPPRPPRPRALHSTFAPQTTPTSTERAHPTMHADA